MHWDEVIESQFSENVFVHKYVTPKRSFYHAWISYMFWLHFTSGITQTTDQWKNPYSIFQIDISQFLLYSFWIPVSPSLIALNDDESGRLTTFLKPLNNNCVKYVYYTKERFVKNQYYIFTHRTVFLLQKKN